VTVLVNVDARHARPACWRPAACRERTGQL